MSPPKLLEAPTDVADTNEHLSMAKELLEKRRAELRDIQIEVTNARARIISERVQWSSQKEDELNASRLRRQELEEQYRAKLEEASKHVRVAEVSLESQRQLEAGANRSYLEVEQIRATLPSLENERLEIERLRSQTLQRSEEVEIQSSTAKTHWAQGQDAIERAERIVAACEQRNLSMNDREDAVTKREAQTDLREKQNDIVERRIDDKLRQLATKEAGHGVLGAGQEGVGGVEGVAGGVGKRSKVGDAGQGAKAPEGIAKPV